MDLDSEAEQLCIGFIEDNYLQDWEDVDPTEINGFNALKTKIENYLYFKRHDPERYKMLKNVSASRRRNSVD